MTKEEKLLAIVSAKSESVELKKEKEILHNSRLGPFSKGAADYTTSIDVDGRLVSSVINVNKGHVVMLAEQGIITRQVARKLLDALNHVPKNLAMKAELEDVHMNVEDLVISKTGKEVGGMLNLAKSRNDQVATAIRMTLRLELIQLGESMLNLEKALLFQAKKHVSTLVPGYTHLQRGQPVTLGHHLIAHYDALDRDFERLMDCYKRTNLSPMGAGALASTGFPIDRERTAELLGFESLVENSLDAVSSRDFVTETIYVCAQTLTDLSRLAEEIILWTTREFSFAQISDEFASTSSMMPQKKNAIVPEILRAKTSQVLGDLVAGLALLKSLTLSYNLDLQELTRNLWSSTDKTIASISIFSRLIESMGFNENIMTVAATSDEFIFATELADYLVDKYQLPFREAHGRVGKLVKYLDKKQEKQFSTLTSEVLEKFLQVKIAPKEIESIVDAKSVLTRRTATGSPNPNLISKGIANRLESLSKHEKVVQSLGTRISLGAGKLASAEEAIAKTERNPRR